MHRVLFAAIGFALIILWTSSLSLVWLLSLLIRWDVVKCWEHWGECTISNRHIARYILKVDWDKADAENRSCHRFTVSTLTGYNRYVNRVNRQCNSDLPYKNMLKVLFNGRNSQFDKPLLRGQYSVDFLDLFRIPTTFPQWSNGKCSCYLLEKEWSCTNTLIIAW